MMIINNAVRWFLTVVLVLALLPIAWVCVVLTIFVGSILALIEELGLDTGIVGDTFIKMAGKWQELYKELSEPIRSVERRSSGV